MSILSYLIDNISPMKSDEIISIVTNAVVYIVVSSSSDCFTRKYKQIK